MAMGRSIEKKIARLNYKINDLDKKRTTFEQRVNSMEEEKEKLLNLLDEDSRQVLKNKYPQRQYHLKSDELPNTQRKELTEGLARVRQSNKEMKALLREIQSTIETLDRKDFIELEPVFVPEKREKPDKSQKNQLPAKNDPLMSLLQTPLFQQMAIKIFGYLMDNKKKLKF